MVTGRDSVRVHSEPNLDPIVQGVGMSKNSTVRSSDCKLGGDETTCTM